MLMTSRHRGSGRGTHGGARLHVGPRDRKSALEARRVHWVRGGPSALRAL